MNSYEAKANNTNTLISTIIACLFSSSDLNISSESIMMGKVDNKMLYKVRIDYINQLISYIIIVINMVVSKIPGLEKYIIEEDINNINKIIRQVIKNDKRLKNSLILRNEYVAYNGTNIDLNEFIGKDDTLIWLVGKIKLYANELISEHDIEATSKDGRSK